MILHCVFCDFRPDVSDAAQNDIFARLKEFSLTLSGTMDFDHGPNRDYEGMSERYDAGFIIKFATREALDIYANHPIHKALGSELCSLCVGGIDGLIVFDLEV